MAILIASTPGQQGPAGNTVLSTTGAPANTVGNNGDFANDVTNQVMYGPKSGGAWPAGVSYKGSNGASGSTILTTSGAPSNSVGNNGDFANDATAQIMYGPKANGSWPAGVSYKGTQGVPGQGARWVAGTSHLGFVATRGKVMSQTEPANKYFNSRTVMEATENLTSIAIVAANFWVSATVGQGEQPVGNPATVKHAIEYPLGGALFPVTWNGGAASAVLQDFSWGQSDFVAVNIPSGAQFAVREYRQVPLGGIIFSGGNNGSSNININTTAGDCFEFSTSVLTDRTTTAGTYANTAGSYFYRPLGVVGMTTRRSYVGIGDSRFEGYMDNYSTQLYNGEFERAIQKKYGWSNLSKGGESIAQVTANNAFTLRAAICRRYATDAVSNYGVNDLLITSSYQTILTQQQQLRVALSSLNFYQTTIETEVSDGATNSVPSTNMTTPRYYINNALRSGAFTGNCMFDGVFDVTGVTESGLNTGLWHAGWTTDGFHLNPTGYAALQAANAINIA